MAINELIPPSEAPTSAGGRRPVARATSRTSAAKASRL
jgi:hypothetical protein